MLDHPVVPDAPDDRAVRPVRGAGRVARRQDRTRRRLTRTARTLIAERGMDALTISELTHSADIGLGSFYSYFASKEALIQAVLSDGLQSLSALAISVMPEHEDPAVRVGVAVRRFLHVASDDPEFVGLLVQALDRGEPLVTATVPYAREVLRPGVESGRFDVSDLGLVIETIVVGGFAVLRGSLAGTVAPSAAESYAELVLRMCGVPAGEARAIARLPLDDAGTPPTRI